MEVLLVRFLGSLLTRFTVADPEGVPWVPWNPSFKGLPSKILCNNILSTLHSHWSYAFSSNSSNNARQLLYIKNLTGAMSIRARI